MINENQEYNALIDSYLDDSMSSEERKSFLKELETNAELKKEFSVQLEIQQAISDPDYEKVKQVVAEVIQSDASQPTDNSPSSLIYQLMKYAAIAIAILVSALLLKTYLSDNESPTTVVAQYFEPYPAYNTFRGDGDVEELLDAAFTHYESKQYKEARVIFTQLSASEPANMAYVFYEANALLGMNDAKAAQPLFLQVVDSDNELFVDPAKWYLALCLLEMDDQEDATKVLKEIAEDQTSNYRNKANSLLQSLQ